MGEEWPRVPIQPDPRISTLRPGWLADDAEWRDQLDAMELDEIRWVERHWDMAGGAEASVDTSWIKMETIGDSVLWSIGMIFAAFILIFGAALLFVGGGS